MLKIWIVILSGFSFASVAFGQVGTVEKVRGKQAIIKFSDKVPKVGERVSVGGGRSTASVERARTHGLRYGATILSTKVDGAEAINSNTFTAEYLRNFGRFELGGGFTMSSSGSDSSSTTLKLIGQYNMSENAPGQSLVPYLRGVFASTSTKVNGASASGSAMGFGGGVNWFPFSELFAVELGLEIGQTSSTPKASTTAITAGWRLYF